MNSLVAELSNAVLPGLVALFGTLLTIALNRASRVAQERWGIEVEARHREALHSAIMSGLLAAVSRGSVGQAAIDAALDHVEASVPDALRKLDPAPGVIREIAEAKLRSIISGIAAK